MDERIKTAYHEAGHAVIAYYRGMPMISVTIVPQEDYLGLLKKDKPPRGWEVGAYGDPLTAWYVGMAMVDCAGVEADIILADTQPELNLEDHEINVNTLISPGTDYSDLLLISSELDPNDLKWASEESGRVLRKNWHVVEAVAEELLKRDTLNKTELYGVLERAKCPKDEEAAALIEKAYREAEYNQLYERRFELYEILDRKTREGSSEDDLTGLKTEIVEIEGRLDELQEELR